MTLPNAAATRGASGRLRPEGSSFKRGLLARWASFVLLCGLLAAGVQSPVNAQVNVPGFSKPPPPAPCQYSGRNEAYATNHDSASWTRFTLNGGECTLIGYINWIYGTVLFRAPDRGGLKFWVEETQEKGLPYLVRAMLQSPEFYQKNNTDEKKVVAIYRIIFRRAPDAGGRDFWMEQLRNGMTWPQVVDHFAASDEFTAYTSAAFYEGYRHDGTFDRAYPKKSARYHEAYSIANGPFEYYYSQLIQTRTWLDQQHWALPILFNSDSRRHDPLNWSYDGCTFDLTKVLTSSDPDGGNGSLVYTQARYCYLHDFFYRNFGDKQGINLDNSENVRKAADLRLRDLSLSSCNRRFTGRLDPRRVSCRAEAHTVYNVLRVGGEFAF